MKQREINCVKSPSGEHAYDLNKYGRDDQGFYVDCIYCGHTSFFACDTEDEFYSLFGLDDDPDDYYSDDDDPSGEYAMGPGH